MTAKEAEKIADKILEHDSKTVQKFAIAEALLDAYYEGAKSGINELQEKLFK